MKRLLMIVMMLVTLVTGVLEQINLLKRFRKMGNL